jgi:hypothetical protein
MTSLPSRTVLAAACMLAFLLASGQTQAQQAGASSIVNMTLSSSAEPVQGWSITHGLLGRPIYASARGKQIGTVTDVVVTSCPAPYVLVIAVGGFIDIGGHAVAVSTADLVEQGGQLIFPGATRASLKAMPRFTYSTGSMQRELFIHATTTQLVAANAQLARLQQRAHTETGAVKAALEQNNAIFQADITMAEDKLADLEKAETARWVLLQSEVKRAVGICSGVPRAMILPTGRK